MARRRITPSEPIGTTQQVPIRDLRVERPPQRNLDPGFVDRIVKHFDHLSVGVIHVSRRAPGDYVVLDGQHRVEALRRMNEGTGLVECKVYVGLTREAEAALFLGLNNFHAPKAIDRFRSAVAAGRPVEVEVARQIELAGFKISTAPSDGSLAAVTQCVALYKGKNGEQVLQQTLSTIVNAWGHTVAGVNGSVIAGLGRFIARYFDELDIESLEKRLATYPGGAAGLIGNGRGLVLLRGGRLQEAIGELLVELYNKGRRTRLVAWRS
jgi:hypothetical protein